MKIITQRCHFSFTILLLWILFYKMCPIMPWKVTVIDIVDIELLTSESPSFVKFAALISRISDQTRSFPAKPQLASQLTIVYLWPSMLTLWFCHRRTIAHCYNSLFIYHVYQVFHNILCDYSDGQWDGYRWYPNNQLLMRVQDRCFYKCADERHLIELGMADGHDVMVCTSVIAYGG